MTDKTGYFENKVDQNGLLPVDLSLGFQKKFDCFLFVLLHNHVRFLSYSPSPLNKHGTLLLGILLKLFFS